MKNYLMLLTLIGLSACGGSDGSSTNDKKVLVAPKILSDFRGAVIATIPNDSTFASGSFYHYRFDEGLLSEESTMALKDPIVKAVGDHLIMVERGAERQQIYHAPLAELASGNSLSLQTAEQEINELSGGDPWEILPFSDESVLYLNANGGEIQKRSISGQIEEDYDASNLGVASLRPVSGMRVANSGRYIIASQGLSNHEIPVLNNNQSLIDLTIKQDGALDGVPQVLPLVMQVPQDFIWFADNTYNLFGLCTGEEQGCLAGAYQYEQNANGQLEAKTSMPYSDQYLQYGGSSASAEVFLAQSKNASSAAIQLTVFSSAEPEGSVLYNFKSQHITNILYDQKSDIVFFGDEINGEGVLVVFDLNSREVLGEVVVNGLPYSLAIYE